MIPFLIGWLSFGARHGIFYLSVTVWFIVDIICNYIQVEKLPFTFLFKKNIYGMEDIQVENSFLLHFFLTKKNILVVNYVTRN